MAVVFIKTMKGGEYQPFAFLYESIEISENLSNSQNILESSTISKSIKKDDEGQLSDSD